MENITASTPGLGRSRQAAANPDAQPGALEKVIAAIDKMVSGECKQIKRGRQGRGARP